MLSIFVILLTAELTNVNELDAELVRRLQDFVGVSNGTLDTCSMAILAFLYIYLSVFAGSGEIPSLTVSVWSELPTGAGLGSSAAYSVCLAAALLSASGTIPSPLSDQESTARWGEVEMELIDRWAFQGERIIHGNPSGVDNAVGTWGKTWIPLPCGILRYHSGKITPISSLLHLRADLIRDGQRHPHTQHYNVLEELIDINQHHLNVMGVGHPPLDTLCRVTLARGLHSKLTGAGGGGCGITLLRPETECLVVQDTIQDLRDCGYDCWETSIGAAGVQQHSPLAVKEEVLEVLARY
ncbi:unnamed protein product [Coregonus sp. 'balchen']|nr:unnamed protein product [Coregonus sp. 'balchen']